MKCQRLVRHLSYANTQHGRKTAANDSRKGDIAFHAPTGLACNNRCGPGTCAVVIGRIAAIRRHAASGTSRSSIPLTYSVGAPQRANPLDLSVSSTDRTREASTVAGTEATTSVTSSMSAPSASGPSMYRRIKSAGIGSMNNAGRASHRSTRDRGAITKLLQNTSAEIGCRSAIATASGPENDSAMRTNGSPFGRFRTTLPAKAS